MTEHWAWDAVFYHIYPLGYCGAPERNDFSSPPAHRLAEIEGRLGAIQALGANAIYLGPVFESESHGYDSVDYRMVDRRLGTKEDLTRLASAIHGRGMRLVLDGVFNHVGRAHPWFRELRSGGPASAAAARFSGVRAGASPYGDGFSYEGWGGHLSLAKLNLRDAPTRAELIAAATSWIEDYGIDGLRLDAADCLDLGFLAELAAACRARRGDFWLFGEIIHGDYRRWAKPGPLDAVTNYECWKGLWSSLAERNYFEIAYALNRQFGPAGLYRGLPLYAFADNHDVDRAASLLPEPALLYPLYCLLFTMPGVPSVYYGSELGARGRKGRGEGADRPLRPSMAELESSPPEPDLARAIARLAALRRRLPALRRGGYRELLVRHEQLAFERASPEGRVIVALNASASPVELELPVGGGASALVDELDEGREAFAVRNGVSRITLYPRWARVLGVL
ncbi:MAG TPA: alpha-amylase family glycosyl hydrolase [Spirochaetales bacterium]|nr:alpha-amylase family glycosyl hydrolase [Spirochaetales bacterium]HRY54072.1 alpha-amylase family glycosyl hydrolase [Spirochaetia bacterium]